MFYLSFPLIYSTTATNQTEKKSVVQVLSDDYLLTFAPILEWLWCWPQTYIIAFFSAVCVLLTRYWLIDWLIVVLYTGTSVTWGRLEISVCYLNSRRET